MQISLWPSNSAVIYCLECAPL